MTSSADEYAGPERRLLTREDIIEMRQATHELTARVGQLSEAIGTVNELQHKQQDLDERTHEIQRVAQQAKDTATEQHQLTEHVVDHLGALDAGAAQRQRLLVRIRWLLVIGAILIVAGIATGVYVLWDLHRINDNQVNYCQLRNASIESSITREKSLADSGPEGQRAAHLASALSLKASEGKC